MNCPNCQATLTDETSSCPNCGTYIPTDTNVPASLTPNKKPVNIKRIIIIILVAVAVIGIATFAILHYFSMRGTCGDGLTWVYNGNGTLTISGYGKMEDYEYIYRDSKNPSYTPGWSDYKDEITLIVIEDGATSIGNQAFRDCNNLKEVIIPDTVKSIGSEAFFRCSSLKEITIPDNVTSIGYSAFENCTSLDEIIIPNGVESIENGTFKYCTNLSEISIPQTVTTIGYSAFDHCTALTSIDLPENLSTIEGNAFSECAQLKGITIPSTVAELGTSAFKYCSNLSDIRFLGDQPVINDTLGFDYFYYDSAVFYGVTATVYYPGWNETWKYCQVQYFGNDLEWIPY